MGLISWFKSLFDKAKATVSRLWDLAKPFLQEALSATSAAVFASLKSLAVEAVGYVAGQGLPTDKAKQDAFKAYMVSKAKDEVGALKDYEINLLRETAVAIWKKSQE